MALFRLPFGLILICSLVACGTMAKPAPATLDKSPSISMEGDLERGRIGNWSLRYTGSCTGRESEPIEVTRLDDAELVFGDFHLLRDETGHYIGSADFIAPMPADGRDVVYTITYSLSLSEEGEFIGTETITEGGGHSLDCPVELVVVAEE